MAMDGRGWLRIAACVQRAACSVRVVGRPAYFVWALELTSWPSDMVGVTKYVDSGCHSTTRDGSV